jgi:hypothetical protein
MFITAEVRRKLRFLLPFSLFREEGGNTKQDVNMEL